MARLSINEAWDRARVRIAGDGPIIVPVALALIGVPTILFQHFLFGPRYRQFVASGGTDTAALQPGLWTLGALPVTALLLIAMIAIARLVLQPGTSVAEALRIGAVRMPALLLASLLVSFAAGLVSTLAGAVGGVAGSVALAYVLLLLFMAGLLYATVRLSLIGVVPAAERGGPIVLLRRAWALTAGAFWRLVAFWLLVIVVSAVVTLFVSVVVGIVVTLLSGGEVGAIGQLVVTIASGVVSAVIYAVTLVILAEIYRQLAGAPDPR